MTDEKRARGRPSSLSGADRVRVCVSTNDARRLNPDSARRAVVMRLIDNGGVMSCAELSESFGFNVDSVVRALVRRGWLTIDKEGSQCL
jgi:hypothetical protein